MNLMNSRNRTSWKECHSREGGNPEPEEIPQPSLRTPQSGVKQSLSIQDSLGLKQTESGFDRFKVANLGNSPAETLAGQKQNSYSMNSINSKNSITFLILFLLLSPKFLFAELENFQAADVVLGQTGFSQNAANNGAATPSASSLSGPAFISSDGKRLFVSDRANNRVLIWSKIPTSNFTSADVVLGQPDFGSSAANNGGVTARSLNTVRDVFSDGRRLFVGDTSNHRVLIWNTIPTTNFTPADVVLGQPDFTSSTVNNGGVSARSINNPRGVFSDGKKLFVADQGNHRILIWNSIPTANFAPADIVLGQPGFNSNAANNGGVSARSLNNTPRLFSDGRRLFVADQSNNRALIWDTIPTANFTPADVVLGQPDFSSNTANNGGVSAGTMNNPGGIFSDGRRLFVMDQPTNRILIWNHIPTINFESADIVLGQPNFNSSTVNNGGVSARSLNAPASISSNGKNLFVTDTTNNRILIFNISGSRTIHDPQFEQGKAVVGKVFNDVNGNGIQDSVSSNVIASDPKGLLREAKQSQTRGLLRRLFEPPRNDGEVAEPGLEGIKVVSDTGIYALTDQDGKYHFPYIETGQRVLKLDESTLPEGSTLTTDNPYKVTVTKGILTKVSFGVKLPEDHSPQTIDHSKELSHRLLTMDHGPLLKLSITQDTQKPTKTLGITAEIIQKGQSPQNGDSPLIKFTTQCNYYLFIKESMILLYDSNQKPIKTLTLPHPIPLYYEIPLNEILDVRATRRVAPTLYYQLVVRDAQGHEDRTSVGRVEIT